MSNDRENKDNDDLLNALESIKGLLEKGESKLSAARESLAKAKQPQRKPTPRIPISTEPVVPVLDDIVSPIEDEEDENIPLLVETSEQIEPPEHVELPILNDITETEPSPTGHSTDEVLAYIDKLHEALEKELHDTLINSLVSIEMDIKNSLQEQIQQLKDLLEEGRED